MEKLNELSKIGILPTIVDTEQEINEIKERKQKEVFDNGRF